MKNNVNNINIPRKGLITDFSETENSNEVWLYSRNLSINSKNGDIISLQNEPSTLFCAEFPYTYIGNIKLKNDRFAIFTTNNVSSEIGILNIQTCTYTKLVNHPCLNFNTSNPIFGASKEEYDETENIYWSDGQLNELRVLNINKIPYTYIEYDDTCKTKDYTDDLDCNELSFTKKFSIPCIVSNKGTAGTLKNGSYQFAIAYSHSSQRITDYFSVTAPISIWSHKNNSGAIELTINSLDRDFDFYQLLAIITIDGVTTYKDLGEFSTSQISHTITTTAKPEFTSIPLEEITVKKQYYQSADYLTSNDQYLFLTGVSTRKQLNYQQQALSITSKYVVYKVPQDFYTHYNDVGYYRDEVYSFSIQWVYEDGELSELFHIAGRAAKSTELGIVYGNDVFESKEDCGPVKENKYWQIYNTASKIKFLNSEYRECDRTILGEGDMAYWESSILYPDNPEQFGSLSCTPIRHHKFPDESKISRYSIDATTSKVHLNILGVKFYNIEHPVDENNKPIEGIVGYKIWRGDRNNNKTVIARGVMTNVRKYTDTISKKTELYSNFPYNYTKPDLFLSEKQTYNKLSGENDYQAPKIVSDTEFTFYAPHCLFNRINLGDYITFNSQETGAVEGFFNEVYKHPKAKLISDNVLYYALIIGAIDGVLRALVGARCEAKYTDGSYTAKATIPPDTVYYGNLKQVEKCNDILKSIANIGAGSGSIAESTLLKAIGTLAKFGAFAFYAAETAQKVIDIIYNVTGWKQYAAQYNSKAFLNVQKIIKAENYRRRIDSYQYLSQGINTIQDSPETQYNNVYKEDNVYIKVNTPVALLTGDTSQTTISKSKTCGNLNITVSTKASLYYSTVKRTFPGQYGQLDSITYLGTGTCIFPTDKRPTASTLYSSDAIFGGDCFINRFSINNPTDLFTHPLFDQPDGIPYDYRKYRALAYPRYWMDTTPYEFLDILPAAPTISNTNSFPKQSNLPRQKYNLDCKSKKGFSLINDRYFYTSVNGVFEFIVESDYNLDNRDWKKSFPDFYTKNSNLQKLFENKGEDRTFEEFIYDSSYSKQITEEIYFQQPLDFDPTVNTSYFKNRVAYSLPSFREQKIDNWTNFLSNDSLIFSGSQFGNLTAIKLLEDLKLLFLFDKSSPYITPGRAELKTTDGKTVYLGDGTLLRDPRPLIITDDNYGNCQSRFAFNQTKFGFFYPSQRKGNLFLCSPELNEISRNGNYYHFLNNLPSKFLTYFPDFKDSDNPFVGVGLTSSYDPSYETYFLTKKDYVPIFPEIQYEVSTNKFFYNSLQVFLTDTKYFSDASYTISYNPSLKAFVSFHDYHPSDYITSENHFFSVINSGIKSSIHQHNVRCDSFCNFYGVDFPHGFTLPINNGMNVQILNSVEYQSETFLYQNNCKDAYHELRQSYDKALIYNTEQISGWMTLNIKQKNNMAELLKYDKSNYNPTSSSFDIYIDKAEQKFRFNQFRDISIDRNSTTPLLLSDESGYKFNVNPASVDYNKNPMQRAKIRHTHSKLYLERSISGANKIIFYFSNLQQTNSPR